MTKQPVALWRQCLAEALGTAGLVAIVVGSGIAASRLSPSDIGLQLLENSIATALGLAVLIVVLQPISGAHFNPVVTIVDGVLGASRTRRSGCALIAAQTAGGLVGAVVANAMFEVATTVSTTDRITKGTFLGEVVATAGLVIVIFVLVRTGRGALAGPVVGAYIGAAYWFTSSTSFANPAVTLGRMITDTFAGIAPSSGLWFIAAQGVGAIAGYAVVRVLVPTVQARQILSR